MPRAVIEGVIFIAAIIAIITGTISLLDRHIRHSRLKRMWDKEHKE